jgi:hypothetical protein
MELTSIAAAFHRYLAIADTIVQLIRPDASD